MSGMYIRARKRGDSAEPPSITAVAFPVRTRKPMPADSPGTPPLAPRRTFRWRTGVGTKDPPDESSVRLRTPRTDAHSLVDRKGWEGALAASPLGRRGGILGPSRPVPSP